MARTKIYHGNFRFDHPDCLQCLYCVIGLTADDQIGLLLDQGGQPFAHQWMVVHDKDSLPLYFYSVPRKAGVIEVPPSVARRMVGKDR
jgi:hypothetical protein